MIGCVCVELMACYIESFLGIWVNTEVLGNRVEKKKIAVWALVGTALCWTMNQYKLYSYVTTMTYMIYIMLISCWRFKCKIMDAVPLTICYSMLLYIIDYLVLTIFVLFWGNEQLMQYVTTEVSFQRSCLIVMSKFLLSVMVYIIAGKWLRNVALPVRKLWISTAGCLVIMIYLMKSTSDKIDIDIVLAWIFFFGIIVIAFYAATQYLKYEKEKSQLDLALEHSNIQLAVYNQLIRNYQDKQIFYHDLKNQHLIIKNYIHNREYEKAEKYLEALEEANTMSAYEKRTGIPVVDILLACKIKEAEAYQIQVEMVAELINTALPEQELISLLGNALDNAIEACQNMQHGTKWIRLKIHSIQEMTMIKIENSYEQQPTMKKGHLLSSKKEHVIHGQGVKSMKAVVEKYDGKMKLNYADGVFSVVISLFH